mgnify:CR=1 FL=1
MSIDFENKVLYPVRYDKKKRELFLTKISLSLGIQMTLYRGE